MTKDDIIKDIESIKQRMDDCERAHMLEDGLYVSFIEDIAKRKDFLGEKARLILSTKALDFSRWYA